MKYFGLIWSGLYRKKLRTSLTLLSLISAFLLLGLLTRISAGALGVVMLVAIATTQWDEVDSLQTLLGLEEVLFLALFLWLAIDGPGRLSLDRLLQERWP